MSHKLLANTATPSVPCGVRVCVISLFPANIASVHLSLLVVANGNSESKISKNE
jgi:hypothetical protein